ncbi:MAG: HAMP domain-containing protein [Nitrospirota bacterium]|nr:MAG: HAMP domain-containing protein [Nitrospirota bacterium]
MVGFGLLLVIFLIYGLYVIKGMTTLADQTADLHAHPFTVEGAILKAELEFIKLHRAMKDVVLSSDGKKISEYLRRIQESEEKIHHNFGVIRQRFLGDPIIVDQAFQAFLGWTPIRAEVIRLKLLGAHDEAASITRGKGADHVALMELKIGALRSFAEGKAKEFLRRSQEIRERSIRITQGLLLAMLIVGGMAAVVISRSILKPLLSLTAGAETISKGHFDHRVSVSSKDELGTLAHAFNAMVGTITNQTRTIKSQNEENERLLLNVLPAPIAERLKQGEATIADSFANVSVLFSDLCGFTELAKRCSAKELVDMLNRIFSDFDELVERHDVEKIKTIGDAYMVVAGLPNKRADHASTIAKVALEMLEVIRIFNQGHHVNLSLRIGINSGPVVAGVIGKKKFIYDLWGDTVNIASRMESHGIPGEIQISPTTYELICQEEGIEIEPRGEISVKGGGRMTTFLLKGWGSLKKA